MATVGDNSGEIGAGGDNWALLPLRLMIRNSASLPHGYCEAGPRPRRTVRPRSSPALGLPAPAFHGLGSLSLIELGGRNPADAGRRSRRPASSLPLARD